MLTLATVPSSTSMENLLQRMLPRTAARSSWRSRALARSPQVSASIRTWKEKKTSIRKSYIISCSCESFTLDGLNSSHLSSSIKVLIFFHLAVSSLVLAPSFHDKGVVDRDAHNLVDALGFNIGGSLNVARQMGLAAARGESSRHSKNNDLGLTS